MNKEVKVKVKIKDKLLYVDDSEPNLVLFRATFKDEYDVFIAESAKEGLELLKEHKFTILVTDQQMPEMKGIEFLEIVAAEIPEVMRFILTAYSTFDVVVEAINKGLIYGYFNKPLKVEEIKASFKKAQEVYYLRKNNKNMILELERANNELLEIDKSRTKYLKETTNQIRKPISKIMSTVHMLKDRVESKDLNELIPYLDSAVSKLESFAYASEQLSLLRDDTIKLKFEKISLKELVEISIIENRPALKEKEIKIDISEKFDNISINGEYNLLTYCLSRVLINSVLHTESQGNLIIKLDNIGNNILCEFIDSGENYTEKAIEELTHLYKEKSEISSMSSGIETLLVVNILHVHKAEISLKKNEDETFSTILTFPGLKA
ncbi:MAG: hybrid sensor histidine kinase/response regulator [Bacteroidales bacterium]|nr:hybrid sensor histidine kinase/response regulator [Bacteroidales bacterium]